MNVATLVVELLKLPQGARIALADPYSGGVVRLLGAEAQVALSAANPDDDDTRPVVLIG